MPAWWNEGLARIQSAVASFFVLTRPQQEAQVWWGRVVLVLFLLAGSALRFWGLGSWGLENDEETMAMPTMHILKDGMPILPSGMFYARGISQLYMMAASVHLFGANEWALRLPSVLCGILLILLVYFFGKRFLRPTWNLALVAVAAFLPGFIADSQEARMYIFMLASLTGFSIAIFEWERTGLARWLVAAVVIMWVGLQFHVLTIFGSMVIFFPGLLHGDRKLLVQASGAFILILIGYVVISRWIDGFYPPMPATHGVEIVLDEHGTGVLRVGAPAWLLAAGVLLSASIGWWVSRGGEGTGRSLWVGILGFICCVAFVGYYDHIGLLALAAALVVAGRTGEAKPLARLAPVLVFVLLMFALQFWTLRVAGVPGTRKILGAMIGMPSIWPMLRMAPYTISASVIGVLGFALALWRFARGNTIPDFWLFFALSVWIPLLLLGLFAWNVEARYTEFALIPLAACVLAFVQQELQTRQYQPLVAAMLAVLIINPIATAHVVNAGYTIHPDHKGAAEYIRSLKLHPGDVLVAEDVNQQTYYLGRVDYWLIGQDIADRFSEELNGRQVDIYTHTPIIGSGEQLWALVHSPHRGAIYVIGSGEEQQDGRRIPRGHGIFEALEDPVFRVVWEGRDGLTRIWMVAAPPPVAQPEQPEP